MTQAQIEIEREYTQTFPRDNSDSFHAKEITWKLAYTLYTLIASLAVFSISND
jgi:hypothetical protein